jgi:hypothetical protein
LFWIIRVKNRVPLGVNHRLGARKFTDPDFQGVSPALDNAFQECLVAASLMLKLIF